ncbi:hypothetical protein BofuT4_P147130.1 [Botrytis cinerea T4]|uniref:Uncharacterized protein n=1 Tax=Botryotinia fuckeliana (strain T4) TaxID=999810 RepID=G2YY46_BOTF4|nr:hypothetical protein BofuT4_P147130.1 [Botrytis cinerea T4]
MEDSESIAGYPTLSGLPIQSSLPFASAIAFSSLPPIVHLTRDTVAASVTASATAPFNSIQTTYNTAPEFVTASPLLYTGDAFKIQPTKCKLMEISGSQQKAALAGFQVVWSDKGEYI